MNELEKNILDIIERRYKKKYIGGLKVFKLSSGGYKLILYMGVPNKRSIQISADLDEQNFLKFIEQEIISRQLIRTQWFKDYEQGRTANCEN